MNDLPPPTERERRLEKQLRRTNMLLVVVAVLALAPSILLLVHLRQAQGGIIVSEGDRRSGLSPDAVFTTGGNGQGWILSNGPQPRLTLSDHTGAIRFMVSISASGDPLIVMTGNDGSGVELTPAILRALTGRKP